MHTHNMCIDRERSITHIESYDVLILSYTDTLHNLRCNVIFPFVNLEKSEGGARRGRLDNVLG